MSRRRRVIAVSAVAVAAVAAGAGVAFMAATGAPSAAAGTLTKRLPEHTTQVARQTLVATQDEDGTLGHGDTTTLVNRVSGTVTRLAGVGSVVKRGGRLYDVDDDPVVLLYGDLPAYRTLASGLEGKDVLQFERNLKALGYTGFTVDKTFNAATAKAVKQWQDDLGLAKTGTVEPGRIVYLSGPVRVDSRQLAVGAAAQPGATVLTWTGTARVVSAQLDVADKRIAKVGSKVTVTLPDDRTVPGTVIVADTVVEAATDPNSDPTTKLAVTVAVRDSAALADYDAGSVKVAFTTGIRKDVLSVPVSALLALAEGGYGVEVVEGAGSHLVAVQTGLFADGQVEVSGGGLAAGNTVGVAG